MPNKLLEISDLKVRFATDRGMVPAVKGISLEVAEGEILAIVGESGSGKSVTSKAILRMLPETAEESGAVILNGQNMISLSASQLREARGSAAAMVFQEPSTALNPVFPVGWQIMEGLRAHRINGKSITKKQARAKAIQMLESVGIPDAGKRVDYFPHQFSGGQKQRIVIAAALALEPKLIIADEPTTALDVTVQAEILDLLRDCRANLGASILLITHNMGVVADLSDRVAVMFNGEIVEVGETGQIFKNPSAEYTKKLLAAVPRIRTEAHTQIASTSQVLVKATGLMVEYPGRLNTPAFRAVNSVDFEIRSGEVVGLVGESGSGKTTLGRAIAGLTRATAGSLEVLDHEMVGFRERAFRPIREQIGFVFQDPASSFNPLLKIGECVAEPLQIHRSSLTQAQITQRVKELLEAVQLPADFAHRFPHELSGGQRQRASIARALALQPKLVIADEPTSALDVSVQAKVLELFAQLQQQLGFAALFITHDLAVVSQVAQRVLVMHRGNLVESGPSVSVLTNPQHSYTQKLLASHPIPDPEAQRKHRELLAKLLES